MEVTRRYWITVGVAGVLGVWALFLQRPLLLGGSIALVAWLLANQYQFIRRTTLLAEAMTVTQRVDRNRVTAEETTLTTLSVESPRPVTGSVVVESTPPTGGRGKGGACVLQEDQQRAETAFDVTWPIAGSFSFERARGTFTDPLKLFTHTVTLGTAPTVTVEPRAPREIHVGEGGERIAAGFGEHDAGKTGSGIQPAEIRRYVAGDSTRRIDWKATARLNEPHVREFEAETDLKTQLFVDHRAAMATGRDGERKLDFARQVALALVDNAQHLQDPLGLYAIGDCGLTSTFMPSTNDEQYRTISQRLRELDPTTPEGDSEVGSPTSPGEASRLANRLDGDSEFERAFYPFFAATTTYIQRIESDPLFEAVRAARTQLDGTVRTIIVTDDTRQVETREAIKVATQGNGQVIVFLTPTLLYEEGALSDIEAAYSRYADFESFRRELASLERASAFEVGPRDRLTTVLAAGRKQVRQA